MTHSQSLTLVMVKADSESQDPRGSLLELQTSPASEDQKNVVEPHVVISGSTGDNTSRCPCIQKPEPKDAWVVVIASVFVTFCLATEFGAFGIYYVEYTKLFELPKGPVGWIKGIQTITGGLVGLFTTTFVKVYGPRRLVVVGGFLLSLGYFTAAFAPNIYISYLTHGVIVGIGVNIANVCVLVIVQQHFIRNRVLGSGISFMGFALGGFSSPIIASALIERYGTRGALLVHSAVLTHMIPLGMLFRPPKIRNNNRQKSKSEPVPITKRIQQELCDFSLFKNPLFILVELSGLFVWYNVGTFVSHVPGRAMYYGISRQNAAFLQSVFSCASLVARVMATFIANIKSINVIVFYGVSIVVMAAGPFVFAFCRTYDVMFTAPILFGIGMGSANTVYIVTLVRLFGQERLPRALGLYNIATHAGLALGPPISGLIFDSTSNYEGPFLLCGSLCFGASILLFLVAVLQRRLNTDVKTSNKMASSKLQP